MRNFYLRTLTGIAIVTIIVSAVIFGVYSFLFLCLIINFFALLEFYHLFQIKSYRKVFAIIVSMALLLSTCLFRSNYFDFSIILVNLPLISFIFISELYLKSDNPFSNLAFSFLGMIYITLPFILLFNCAFFKDVYHPEIILGYFFLLWANDTAAYVCGSLFGKYPLSSRVSPNKTWEGSAGGAILVMIFVFINYTFFHAIPLSGWIIIGVIVIVMGTLGDLVKSLMKRSLNVKDSGKILPGHGGILDRFDSLIGSVPFVYLYLTVELLA